METKEMMMPEVETRASEAPSALKTNSSTTQTANPPSQMTSGVPSSLTKKKRGRPRKYGPDGVAGSYSDMKVGEAAGSGGEFQAKKRKRRTYGKSDLSLGDQITSGGSFTPHMVTVNPGEDVTSKIISFSKHGPRAICVLSALGIISNVTLRQPNSSGSTVTYEGRFEILSLSGSFTPGEEFGGISSAGEGGMSIALSSPDGRVVGGQLGGLLTAAAPVQVVVASFLPDARNPVGAKPRKTKKYDVCCTRAYKYGGTELP